MGPTRAGHRTLENLPPVETSVQLATAKEPEGGVNGNGEVDSPPLTEVTHEQALLRLAVEKGAGIETIERLVVLLEKQRAYRAEIEFNAAMNKAQAEMKVVFKDETNTQTKSKWATYEALDEMVRPIYTKHGFSLSFNTGESKLPETILILCDCSHSAGHTRTYHVLMPCDGKGAKGGDVMSKSHAVGAAMSYGMRYLAKFAFNIAIGEDDTDGNTVGGLDDAEVEKNWQHILDAKDVPELKSRYTTHMQEAREANDTDAQKRYIAAKDARKKELENAPY